ncbi:MAG TPA: hypothetical protein VFO08_03305 [Methylomirabilota bacterium]|nr:hypothetical protein [Methylomirabilota bacterium]
MNRNWTIGLWLTLLLIGGLAPDASAQQPSAPTTPSAPAESRPPAPDSSAPGGTPQSQPPQMQQAPNVQTETRTERIVEREPGKFLGVDPTVAMIVGAVLLIVIVFALVAMGRRRDEIHHTHHTQPRV